MDIVDEYNNMEDTPMDDDDNEIQTPQQDQPSTPPVSPEYNVTAPATILNNLTGGAIIQKENIPPPTTANKRKPKQPILPAPETSTMTDFKTPIPAPLLNFMKNLRTFLHKSLPQMPLELATSTLESAINSIKFPKTSDTDSTPPLLYINLRAEEFKVQIIQAVLCRITYEQKQNLDSIARYNGLELYDQILKEVQQEDWIKKIDLSNNRNQSDWGPSQI